MSGPTFPSIGVALPVSPFNHFVGAFGMRLQWMRSHACPCTYGTSTPGSPDTACLQCGGYGTYWDDPVGPFKAFVTFRHLSQSPDEPGMTMDRNYGMVNQSSPMVTVPYSAASGVVWTETSTNDAFIELDSVVRYETTLTVGGIQSVPYQRNYTGMLIETSGAVTTYNTTTHLVTQVSGYTVNGGTVTMPVGTPDGTPYTVTFHSNPVYFVFRKAGGMPHVRPPGGEKLPRGYHVQPLDIWTRARDRSGFTPNSVV